MDIYFAYLPLVERILVQRAIDVIAHKPWKHGPPDARYQ